MAEVQKQSRNSGALGIIFKEPIEQSQKEKPALLTELYGRSLSSISKPAQPQVRAAFNVENGLSGKAGEAGTFISDQKKDRPSFFENVAAAFSEWHTMVTQSRVRNKIVEEPAEIKTSAESGRKIMSEPTQQEVPHIAALKSVTIEPGGQSKPDSTPHLKRSSTMHDAASTPPMTDTSIPASELVARPAAQPALQKMRTFKSDAAMLRTDREVTPVPQMASTQEPKPSETSTPKLALKKRDVHIVPVDMRASMIAPEVDMRINVKDIPVISKKPETQKQKPTDTIAPNVPLAQKPVNIPLPKSDRVVRKSDTSQEETPQWTYVLDADTSKDNVPEIASVEPEVAPPQHDVRTPDVSQAKPTESEHDMPHKDRSVRIEEKLQSTQSTTMSLPSEVPLPLPVGPEVPFTELPLSELAAVVKLTAHSEIVPTAPVPAYTPTVDIPKKETLFHEGSELEHVPITPTSTVDTSAPRPLPRPFRARSTTTGSSLRFAMRLMLVLVVSGAFIVGGVYLFTRVEPDGETPSTPVDPTRVVSDIPDIRSHELILKGDMHVFFTDVQRTVADAPSGLTEFSVYIGEPPRRATTQEFFTQLPTTLSPRTIRALEPVFTIGSVTTTHNEPFIIIRSNNFDALFAGLLAWEPSIYEAFTPLFHSTSTDAYTFTDAVRNNRSIRILHDADGTEIMLYSFIDDRTVAITSSSDALAKLIEHF